MRVFQPEIGLDTDLGAWWTDNDNDVDFTICAIGADHLPSLGLSYAEAKRLYDILGQKLSGRGNFKLQWQPQAKQSRNGR